MAEILVFDVNHERLMRASVALAPHRVIGVGNLLQAVQETVLSRPDLIISDWKESSGFKLLRELQGVPNFVRPPICFMDRALGQSQADQLRTAALKNGAIGFIPRPISNIDLFCQVSGLLGKIRLLGYRCRPVEPEERRELVDGDPVKMTVRILSEPVPHYMRANVAASHRLASYPPKLRLMEFEDGRWFEQSSN